MTTYNNAAPHIRHAMVSSVSAANDVSQEPDREAGWAEAMAYKNVLRILSESEDYDYDAAPGIADRESLLDEWVETTVNWLGEESQRILGE